jgi:hypothetical protein
MIRRRKIFYYSLYLFIILLFTFAIAELAFSLIFPESPFNEVKLRHPTPYVVFAGKPNADVSSQTVAALKKRSEEVPEDFKETLNELGYRGDLPTHDKGNEFRIFLLGGSTAYHGFPYEKTISQKLETQLKQKGLSNAKVYNFGVASANSGQELSLLIHKLVNYNPDMVISYDGGNDLQPYLYDPRPNYPYDFAVREKSIIQFKELENLKFSQLLLIFFKKSRVINHFFRQNIDNSILYTPELRKEVGYGSPQWKQQIVVDYAQNIMKMQQISSSFGFDHVALLQPIVIYKEPLVGQEKNLFNTIIFAKDVYDSFALNLENLEQVRGLNFFYDLRDVFDGQNQEFFWDFIHINEEPGHDILADVISDIVLTRIKSNSQIPN